MIDVLYKKAKGYDVEETTQEYVVDEEGNKRLVKEKTAIKHVPPDLAALKAYMELRDTELSRMSNEELEKEKERLINILKMKTEGETNNGSDGKDGQ